MPVRDLLSAASTQGATPADPYFYDVSLLLNGDGTNGAQNNTFLDSSTNNFTITRNGNTTQGSFSPYGSLWGNYFNGSSSISTPSNSALNLTGDFTAECWFYAQTVTNASQPTLFSIGSDASGLVVGFYTGTFYCYFGAVGGLFTSVTPPLNQWVHFAWVRNGSTNTLYINGVSQATSSQSGTITSTGGLTLGRTGTSGSAYNYFQGYISNFRYNNTALYTSNFTPSTTPLTAVSGTLFLTSQSNRFIDNSSNALTISVAAGTPSVQRFSPFNPTSTYSTSVIGGSGYFDGSGDYLNTTATQVIPATGNFTVESWFYPTSNNTYILNQASSNNPSRIDVGIDSDNTCFIALGGTFYNSTNAFKLNSWNHFAITRSSSTFTVFINGTLDRTITSSLTIENTTLLIGTYYSLTQNYKGYITDLRVSPSVVYTITFTLPTAPLTTSTSPNILLSYTNAGIPDLAMQNNLETVGSAQVSTSVKKYGTGSLSFNGTTDYLTTISKPSVQLGSGNFTIEFWIYYTSISGYKTPLCSGFSSTGDWLFQTGNGDGKMNIYISGTDIMSESTGASTNTWYHYALVRNGSTITLYNNGTSVASATNTVNLNSASSLTIGGTNLNSGQYFAGYIDDIRITNGLARYTANFTPPTSALPTY